MTEADVQTPAEVYAELVGELAARSALTAWGGWGRGRGAGCCQRPRGHSQPSLFVTFNPSKLPFSHHFSSPTTADGYDVDYLRVPVTDEKAPKPSDFQLLIEVWGCWLGGWVLAD